MINIRASLVLVLLLFTTLPKGEPLTTPLAETTTSRIDAVAVSRRSVLGFLSLLPATITVQSSCAQEIEQQLKVIGKPFSPQGALLPAARLKAVVDKMYQLSLTLPKDKEAQYQALTQIKQVWDTRPPLFLKTEKLSPRSISPGSAQLTTGVSSANKQQYQGFRKDLSFPDRIAAILNQADVERQWGILQYQESKREQGNEFRAALNFYTSQLEFGDTYLLTASPEDRKRMIRNDELPSLTAVITSDLDLRDLYRNYFLTALEDVTAEVAYQLKQSPDQVDVRDVVELMEQTHTAIQKWSDLIATEEVEAAMSMVQNEQQSAG